MIRVLVAEDSPTTRELLLAILGSDPEIRIVGEARNGVEAVEKCQELRPDLVTMDIHMPRMDGLEATRLIMKEAPTPVVIISGQVDEREATHAADALRAGALGVLATPVGPRSPDFERSSRRILELVKGMAQVKLVSRHSRAHTRPSPVPSRLSRPVSVEAREARVRGVAVATSTGGPAALTRLLAGLPSDFPVPILVVQHISPGFVKGLASSLNAACALEVKLAEREERVAPGTVYIAPDECHLAVTRHGRITLSRQPPTNGFRPSGDVLFQAVAGAWRDAAVAVILTGMGEDGVEGLGAVRDAGGLIVAQDQESSVVFGMPGAAIEAGLPDVILGLDQIADYLVEVARDD